MFYFKGVGRSVRRLPRILSVIVLFILLSSVISVVQAQPPALILSKTTDGNITTAEVGQVLHYRIRFECSSLSTACGQLQITDVLQAGLTYLPAPDSSVPAGFSIAYNAGTRTITITKDDNNFLDGTQFDAVIAVLIDYNLRPLPTTINNTVNGTVDPPGLVGVINAAPSSAPPITIDTATLDWGMTKTLYRPSINPTVDTNVTYQIALCPNSNEGNVALQNVVITDNLPPGAVFVSASDGGTAVGGVVTWPSVVGPTYPPACITRFVTIRYPTPTFAVGNTVTNTANANGQYLGSAGAIIGPVALAPPPTINHPIDPISEVPTYSKSDVGDPVGINGTGRFVLNLNTNNTNYPSNNVVLIDNMPPNLQVTEVTSGTWPVGFDNVRAYVEYSTNNANSWTAFPGQPIAYNANVTYAAPVTNITNVRWRFEYDDPIGAPFYENTGLPYTWSFANRPEIRFVPRLTATTADAPSNAPMPIAAPGNTYTNCLQVSRTSSTGNAVTEPCYNEDMTVEGNVASLRAYKNETPGTSWDDIGDPNINTFTADTTILPNDTLRYVITVELTERSSAPLINPTIRDTLPPGLTFVRNGTAQLDGANLPAGQQPTFTIVGNDLTWEWNAGNAITVNQQVLNSRFLTVEFYGRIPRGQAPGPYTNALQVVTDSVDAFCEVGTSPADVGDLDGDGNVAEPTCVNPDIFTVERSAALRGEKWIRSTDTNNAQVLNATTFLPDATCPDGGTAGLPGGGNNPFTRFPCISQAFPEGALSNGQLAPPPTSTTLDDFEYNIRIFNDGNVDMTQYILYDILPYFGDTGSGGTLSSTPRLSEFQPLMRSAVLFISGPPGLTAADFTIEYNNTINPCRPEVFNLATGVNSPGGCDNTWTTTWSANARSYRIRMKAGSLFPQTASAPELRFGVPMYIPADAPPVGTFTANDPQSLEIAWNSFAHTGSYLDLTPQQRDLLASEPRKVGITIPERMSIGNRVWRDADNSGTINAPDDTNPGIGNVVVNLYRDADNNGVADGAAIATTTTDANGYYLFSNIIFDSVTAGNNIYMVGIPASNFMAGKPLFNLESSTGPLPGQVYVTPALGTTDSDDNGRDPATAGQEVFSASINLTHNNQPTGETDLSTVVPAPGVPATRDGAFGRGVNGEADADSNLQIDFGFFSQLDYFSIGNRVWFDNGAGGGVLNNGIMDGGETPFQGVTVELYRDGNANGQPDAAELIRTDITDAGGYYLFDQLDPGNYFVVIPASNFNVTTGVLKGLFSSQPTGTELAGVAGNTNTPNTDRDDNGINVVDPSATGVRSGVIALVLNTAEATGETDLSGQADPGAATHFNNNPTAWDGPGSIGRYGEDDDNSNVTIDFGFIPPLSIGNRVWLDTGAGTSPFRSGFNNGLMDGTEAGVAGVRVELWQNTNGTAGLQIATDTLLATTTTDANGYYLFDRVQPANNYYIHIPASNFGAGNPLVNTISSYDANQTTAPADDNEDKDDNGIDSATPATTGITSSQITMAYGTEPITPTNETDISGNAAAYGPNNVGLYGQQDADSNLTFDFGFVNPPRSIGNRVWFDVNNNGQINGVETGVANVRVSLYLDTNTDGAPDDLGVVGDRTDDWVAFDTTDATGYYLFDNLPPNNYIVGVDRINFTAGNPLDEYASSTGNVDNAGNDTDSLDNGIDRVQPGDVTLSPFGVISTRINLTATPLTLPTGETGSGNVTTTLGFNPTAGDGANSRGRYGETDADSDLTIDFGFFKPLSIGNRVFLDNGAGGGTTNNGIMDGTEAGIAGVRVELYRDNNSDGVPDGGFIRFDTTDANGYYLFDRLTAGNYIVGLPASNFAVGAALSGMNSSQPTGTENTGVVGDPYTPNTDRDDNGINAVNPATTGVFSGTLVLTVDTEPTGETELSGQADPGAGTRSSFSPTGWDGPNSRGRWNESDDNSNLTIDFGFILPLSIGNRVWLDNGAGGVGIEQYNDGIQNGTETGIANVALSLFFDINDDGDFLDTVNGVSEATAIRTTTTDAAGYYLFDGLAPGNYQVLVTAANFGAGQPLNGLSSSTGNTNDITTDVDDNGIDDTNYLVNGIRGNTLSLRYGTQPTTETDIPPNNVGNTTAYGVNLRGRSGEADADSNLTMDFGFNDAPYSLGNRVWLDSDNSGTLNGAETAIAGVTVNLLDTAGNPVDNPNITGAQNYVVTTDSNGYYRFDGLPAGNYVVEIAAANFTGANPLFGLSSSTGAGQLGDPNAVAPGTDSDDNGLDTPVAGAIRSGTVTLGTGLSEPTAEVDNAGVGGFNGQGPAVDGRSNLTVDFGFYQGYSLGNRVWLDSDNSGTLNGAETGIAGVTVNLLTTAGATVDNPNLTNTQAYSVTTDANGYYRFDNLPAGDYVVEIAAANFTGANPLFGLSSSTGTGQLGDPNAVAPGTDSDDNGLDTPVTGAIRSGTVTLGTGLSEPTAEVDNAGVGGFNGQGSTADGRSNLTVDFGFYQGYSLGNRVWLDSDNSGTLNGADGGTPGIANVVVNLLTTAGATVDNPNLTNIQAYTVTTDANGYYRFDNLPAGDYVVEIAASNFTGANPLFGLASSTGAGQLGDPNEVAPGTDSDDNGLDTPVTGAIRSDIVTLGTGLSEPTAEVDNAGVGGFNGQGPTADGRSNLTVDFGFFGSYVLGNRVWLDSDNSGTLNGAETGIAGVTVGLLNTANNPVDNPNVSGTQAYTVTTDANGYYRFDNLPAGDYVVEIAASNFTGANPLFGLASSTGAGQLGDPNAVAPGTDSDDNGLDTPVAGAIRSGTVTLGTGLSEPTAEVDNAGVGGFNGQGPTADGRSNLTVDFGFYQGYSLGNRVWIDDNNSGNIDGADGATPGVAGVLVNLLTTGGTTVDNPNLTNTQAYTVTTDANGYYRFDNLPAGDYVVEIAASNFLTAANPLFGLFNSTGAAQLADPNAVAPGTDSDDNGLDVPVAGAIRSGTVTLGTGLSEPTAEADNAGVGGFNGQGPTVDGRSNLTVDFGFYPAYTLGNRVWADLDNSGDINGADTANPGISGVVVNLLTTGGATVDNPNVAGVQPYTVTTDANGYYRFDNLPAGDYVVEVAATNFAAGGMLQNAVTSIGPAQEASPNSDGDSNDNGLDTPVAGAIRSATVTLGGNAEPTNDTDVPATGAFAGQGPTIDARANMTVDFGFVPGFSLGNRVWMDDGIGGGVSNDGILNGGELGIANVQVQLLDNLGNPADNPAVVGIQPYIVTTDANGYYRFDRLPAGDYIVEVIAANFAVGQPLQSVGSSNVTEALPNADVDNTDNGIDALPAVAVRSGTVTLGPGYNEPLVAAEPDVPIAGIFATQGTVDAWANMTVDFGFVRLFSLGNRVWRDDGIGGGVLNDGIQNGAEAGINNVTVRLLDAAGNPADNPNIAGVQDYIVTTSPQGYYRFDNLSQGNYIVEIVAANFVGGGTLANFTSSTGAGQEANPNADADVNDNGLDVPVAGGIRSGQVTLGPLAAEPTVEDAPFGQGAPDLQANMTVDFGFVPGSYSLGNRVWIDTDNSGTINGGEAGVNGVAVRLLNNVGTVIANTTTAGGGYYRFDNLAAGNYVVEVAATSFGAAQPLFGLVSSTGVGQLADPNAVAPGTDNDDNGLDAPFAGAIRSGTVTLGPGDSEPINEADLSATGQGAVDLRANMTVDFGFITPPITFSLGNRVWFDADNNGTINAFDGPTPGIANVTVNLLNAGGAQVGTTTTDATGHYRFDNLAAGDYVVEIAAGNFTVGQPLLNLISSSGPGQEATPNSDVDNNDNGLDVPVGGAIRSGTVTLGPTALEPTGEIDVVAGGAVDNQSNLTVDFGFTNPVNTYSIGNHVWRDNGAGANTNNGRMDAGEAGIAGVTVNLLDGTGTNTVATTTTDANGYYRFDNLPAGNYIVQIAASNFTAGNPLEATTSSTGALQEANPNGDVDLNDNGLDVLVAGAVRSGIVTLGGAPPEPINETDLAPTGQGAVDNRANMTVDFGFVDAFSLGNRVWRDDGTGAGGNANNGFQDGTEPGIAGVTVRLFDGTGNTLIATTTTDANGYYRFDSLVPGTYIVEIAAGNFGVGNPLNGLSSSPVTNPNPDGNVDLDDNGLDVAVAGAIRSGQVTLGPTANEPTGEIDLAPSGQGSPDNRANMTVDFGFGVPTNTFSLGNRVWLDDGTGGGTANNGIQDGTEIGEVGVAVNLLDNTGTLILATQFTDINGYYRFDGLAAGNYFVEVAAGNFAVGQPLNGLLSSAVTVADPNSDIDRDDNGIDAPPGSAVRSGLVTLAPTEPLNEADLSPTGQGSPDDRANMTVDFGFAAPATTYSLGNRVWLDADNDGTLNGAEVGIAGVTVRVLDITGTTTVGTTTTDANGYYRFDNLAPGDYLVEIASTNFTAGQPLEGLASSSGAGQEATPNSDADNNDNGLDTFINGGIRSGVVTLGATEPLNEADLSPTGQGSPDDRANMTVDFGFTSSYSLGNRVWFDVNNNSLLDAGEVGIGGVRVELYRDTDTNGAYTAGTDVLINAVTTDGLGYYLFTGLAAGDYIVVIPASNFAAAGNPLFGYYSSATSRNNANGNIIETAAPDPDNDTDSDDNGTTAGVLGTANGIVVSLPVTIGGVEPINEPDPTSATFQDPTPDNRSNITVDFGFYTMTLGNLVWFDADDSGLVNGTEAGLDGVTVYLFPVGGNLAGPPLATTTTANGGLYSFPGLAAGDYIVQIPATNFSGVLTGFSSSTGGAGNPFETAPGVDPNPGVDNDDNGVHTAGPASPINSRPITLTAGGPNTIIDNATGRSTNNTLDFGLKSSAPLIFSLGNRVFLDFDNSGSQDASEPGISGVQVRLLDSASNPYDTDPNTAGVQQYVVTTDVSGYYRFDNLPAGDYIVQILDVNFQAGGRLLTYASSTPDELLPNNDVDRNDNGIGTAFIPGTGIVSGVVTLGPAEPTGETDLGTGAQGAADNRANMTVDFGFTPPTGLIIDKDDGLNAIVTGNTTTYTVNIFNNTGVVQNNVVFTDNVPVTDPEGFDPASVSWTCSSTPGGLCPTTNGTTPTINETIATIPVGGRVIYSISGRVRPCQTACGVSITNIASLGTGETDNDVDGIISDPPTGVKVGSVVNGTTIHWEMTWSSTAAAGQTVVITDAIPAGQTFAGNLTCQPSGTSTQTSCSFSNGAVVWEGTIFGGAANQVVIAFDVNVAGAGSYSNSATLTQPGTNVSVVATASVGISTGAGPTQVPPQQCNITITPDPAFAVAGGKVNWSVNATIVDNTKPNIITITLPAELTLLGVDAAKGAKVTVKGGVITITIDPGVALGPYPAIVVRTQIKRNLKAPFTITVLGWMNDHECQASVTILSVDALPETGQHPPLNVGGILLLVAGISAGFGLIVVGWKRRKIGI